MPQTSLVKSSKEKKCINMLTSKFSLINISCYISYASHYHFAKCFKNFSCLKTKRDKTLVLTKPELMMAHRLTRIKFLYSK